jgi:hypothetical protein
MKDKEEPVTIGIQKFAIIKKTYVIVLPKKVDTEIRA